MDTLTVSEARAALPELLNRVGQGEEITITRHGRAVAVLVRPDLLRSRRLDELRAGTQQLRDLLTRAHDEAGPVADLTPERADELVRDIRADRDAR